MATPTDPARAVRVTDARGPDPVGGGAVVTSAEPTHTVTIEFDSVGYTPTLTFKCQAPEGADCRIICHRIECEEGCYDATHERTPTDYCNNVTWFENMDDVETCIDGKTTSITAPVLVGWSRGEEGPDWRFAVAEVTSEVESDRRIRSAQEKARAFLRACGGSVPLGALRLYIETQERSDAVISRALVAPDTPFRMGRSADGTPLVSLIQEAAGR